MESLTGISTVPTSINTQEMAQQSKRIKGYDIARGLAVFTMVFVNFEMVLAEKVPVGLYHSLLDVLHGKGAALFVVLAGAGMSLMLKTDIVKGNRAGIWKKQSILLRRSAFLFIFGLLYFPLWPADILHFYGFFISIGALLSTSKNHWLWIASGALIFVYPLTLLVINYETGWNWDTLNYDRFWTLAGFIRNLFLNGFHPVIPWLAFVFVGLWLGRQDLANKRLRMQILAVAGGVFICTKMISLGLMHVTRNLGLPLEDIHSIFGTQPMPPLPLYMISGISFSFVVITACITFSEKYHNSRWIDILVFTGQMAFTHYIGHVIIGMLIIYFFIGENQLSVAFTFWYAVAFCVVSVFFSWVWRSKYNRGPISILMRWITG